MGARARVASAAAVAHRVAPPRRFARLPPSLPAADAAAALSASGALLGGRSLQAEPAAGDAWPAAAQHSALAGHAGRTVAVAGVPEQASLNDVEALFAGYALAPDPVRPLRRGVPQAAPPAGPRAPHAPGQLSGGPERRTMLVRFSSALEARCAARDKHRAFLGAQAVDVRVLP